MADDLTFDFDFEGFEDVDGESVETFADFEDFEDFDGFELEAFADTEDIVTRVCTAQEDETVNVVAIGLKSW